MQPKLIAAIALLGLALSAGGARAEDDFARSGLYGGIGAAIGLAPGYEDRMEGIFGLQTRVDSPVGASARAGWRALPWLAVEAQFEWLPGFDVKTASGDPRFDPELPDSKIVDATTWMFSANAKAFWRSDERFQPFAQVGFGYMRTSNQVRHTSNGVLYELPLNAGGYATRIGGGIDAYIDRHWLIEIDAAYVIPTGVVSELDYVSIGIGLQYRF